MPRWTSCYIDKRAISNKGQWGTYKCEKCGKIFIARMCEKKRAKHIFCSTKCKKDFQVKYDRPRIDDNVYRQIYKNNYNLVKTCAFQVCENNYRKLQYLEDCMQYGFLELWKTYNRNGMDCSQKYLRKSIKHAMFDGIKYWFDGNKKYVPVNFLELIKLIEGAENE